MKHESDHQHFANQESVKLLCQSPQEMLELATRLANPKPTMKGIIERNPFVGIITTLTGSTASILAALQMFSLAIGCTAGLIGVVVGYYTLRIKMIQYRREQKNKRDEPEI